MESYSNTLKVLAGEMHVDGFARELNRDPHILNVANGVVNLRTGELDIHRPQYLCTQIITTTYRVSPRTHV
jgi:phage/plasmid-associated DNA primase